jgi:hypothetical protein
MHNAGMIYAMEDAVLMTSRTLSEHWESLRPRVQRLPCWGPPSAHIALGVEEVAQPDGGRGRVITKSRVSTTDVDYSVQNLGTKQPVSNLSNGPTEFDQKMGKTLTYGNHDIILIEAKKASLFSLTNS